MIVSATRTAKSLAGFQNNIRLKIHRRNFIYQPLGCEAVQTIVRDRRFFLDDASSSVSSRSVNGETKQTSAKSRSFSARTYTRIHTRDAIPNALVNARKRSSNATSAPSLGANTYVYSQLRPSREYNRLHTRRDVRIRKHIREVVRARARRHVSHTYRCTHTDDTCTHDACIFIGVTPLTRQSAKHDHLRREARNASRSCTYTYIHYIHITYVAARCNLISWLHTDSRYAAPFS